MNIAQRLVQNAKAFPNKTALIFPEKVAPATYKYHQRTFKEFNQVTDRFAHGLLEMGFKKGDKTLLFIRPSLDFSCLVFALFKIGVVPIFIDPGMGRKKLLQCIEEVAPDGLISEKEVHFARLIFRKPFKGVKYFVTNGNFRWGKMKTISSLLKNSEQTPYEMDDFNANDTAAILFTSGGTGAPKGVVYSHSIFWNQTQMLQEMFGLTPDDVDVPGFPLFSLFTIAMGMSSCIPDMDPSKPAQCDPASLVANIQDQKGTFIAGSPAIWERVGKYCLKENITLPSVKYLVMFGAPVSHTIHEMFQKILPNGDTYTPYGATECLPVSNARGSELLKKSKELSLNGLGTNIGRPVSGVTVKIIKITDDIIPSLTDDLFLNTKEMGEIIVTGPTVTQSYFNLEKQTEMAKIKDSQGVLWHRMGDLGYFDEQGQLWFCGRKTHRVETSKGLLSSIQVEAIFNRHPEVKRSALIGLGAHPPKTPAIVIERLDHKIINGKKMDAFKDELKDLAKDFEHAKEISKFFQSSHFPVDIRHNIKIDRGLLARQADQGKLS